MLNDELYKLSAEYFRQKIWRLLSPDQMFGVELEDKKIAYCSVEGKHGGEIYFSVYVGTEGLDSYRNINSRYEFFSENEDFLLSVSLKCLRVGFSEKDDLTEEEIVAEKSFSRRNKIYFCAKGSHPRFFKYSPLQIAYSVEDEEDKKILAWTLSAALDVGEKLTFDKIPRDIKFENRPQFRRKFPLLAWTGEKFKWTMKNFPPLRHLKYPSAKLTKKDAEKLLAAQKSYDYCCELYLFPKLKYDTDGIAKFIMILITVNLNTGRRIKIEPDLNYLTAPEKLTKKIAKSFLRDGVPKKIFVRMERTFQFLEKFCEQTGIEICETKELPEIDAQVTEVEQYFKINEMKEDRALDKILNALENEPVEILRKKFPTDLKMFLSDLTKEDFLPPYLKNKILKIAEVN